MEQIGQKPLRHNEYFSYKAGGGGESSEAAIWVGHTYGGRSAVWNGSNWSEISDMIKN